MDFIRNTSEKVKNSKVLNMCFDKFLLAVESRDLSQADKEYYNGVLFPKLSEG